MLVATQWFFNYLSYSRAARLIVGSDNDADSHRPLQSQSQTQTQARR